MPYSSSTSTSLAIPTSDESFREKAVAFLGGIRGANHKAASAKACSNAVRSTGKDVAVA